MKSGASGQRVTKSAYWATEQLQSGLSNKWQINWYCHLSLASGVPTGSPCFQVSDALVWLWFWTGTTEMHYIFHRVWHPEQRLTFYFPQSHDAHFSSITFKCYFPSPIRSAVEELCLFLDPTMCLQRSSGILWKSVCLPTPSHYFQGAHGFRAREQHFYFLETRSKDYS